MASHALLSDAFRGQSSYFLSLVISMLEYAPVLGVFESECHENVRASLTAMPRWPAYLCEVSDACQNDSRGFTPCFGGVSDERLNCRRDRHLDLDAGVGSCVLHSDHHHHHHHQPVLGFGYRMRCWPPSTGCLCDDNKVVFWTDHGATLRENHMIPLATAGLKKRRQSRSHPSARDDVRSIPRLTIS
jgi:hypothetical protein